MARWQAIRSLADDRSIVIKQVDKRSCVVVWDRDHYLSEAEKQLCDKAIYKDVSFIEKILSDLVASSNKIFKSLKERSYMRKGNERQVIFSTQIHKLFNIPGRPIISNCGAPTEKASEFLNYHLKTGHTK